MRVRMSVLNCLFVVIGVVVSASCRSDKDYRTYIPSDVKTLISVDCRSLAEKAELTDPAVRQTYKDFLQSSMPEDDYRFIEEFLDNPLKSGLALDCPLYMFTTSRNERAILVKVGSRRDVRNLLKDLGKSYALWTLDEEDGFDYAATEAYSIVFNSEALIILFNNQGKTKDNIRMRAMNWLRLEAGNSFISNKDFAVIEKERGDVTGWVSLDIVPDQYKETIQLSMPRDVNLEDLHYMAVMNFEQGRISLQANILPTTEAAAQLYEQQSLVMQPIQGQFLPDASTNPCFWMGISADGQRLYELLVLNTNLSQLLESISFGFDIQKLISSIQGDMAVWMPTSEKEQIVIQAYLKDKSIIDNEHMDRWVQLFALLGIDIWKDSPYAYCMKQSDGSLVWIGVDKDNKFYYTSSRDCLKPAENRLAWADEAEGKLFYLRVDIKALLNQTGTSSRHQSSASWESLCENLVVEMVDNKQLKAEISMTDPDENSFKQIMTLMPMINGKD